MRETVQKLVERHTEQEIEDVGVKLDQTPCSTWRDHGSRARSYSISTL